MQITADQCRAARSLLNWTQEQLATNASVSRATVADFESNARQPMKNNSRSIGDCMFAAGVEFIPEQGGSGVGVRFRERKMEYTTNKVRINQSDDTATMRMRYAGEDFMCVISREAIDDYCKADFATSDEFKKAIIDNLHIIRTTAERYAPNNITDGKLIVTSYMLQQD